MALLRECLYQLRRKESHSFDLAESLDDLDVGSVVAARLSAAQFSENLCSTKESRMIPGSVFRVTSAHYSRRVT